MLQQHQYISTYGNAAIGTERWEDIQVYRCILLDYDPLRTPKEDLSPGRMYGWYNKDSDMVELFYAVDDGSRVIRVSSKEVS